MFVVLGFLRYINSLQESLLMVNLVALKRAGWLVLWPWLAVYLEPLYLVTVLVHSDTVCLDSSPGSRSLTAVWNSPELMVLLVL